MKFIFTMFAALLLFNTYGWCSEAKKSLSERSRSNIRAKNPASIRGNQNISNNFQLSEAEIRQLIEKATPPKVRCVIKVDQEHDIITYLPDHS